MKSEFVGNGDPIECFCVSVPRAGEEEIHTRAATIRNEAHEAIGGNASDSRRNCAVC